MLEIGRNRILVFERSTEETMKLLSLFLLVLVSIAGPSQQRNDGLEIEYDKFQDRTIVNIKDSEAINVKGAKVINFIAAYKYEGRTASKFTEPEITIGVEGNLSLESVSEMD